MTRRGIILSIVVFTLGASTVHADWCSPCYAAVTPEPQFQRVSAIVRCGFCGVGTTAHNTSVTVNGSMTLQPDGKPDRCQGAGYCGMSSVAEPLRASTTYTANGTFEASQLFTVFSTKTVSGTGTTDPPATPPGSIDICDDPGRTDGTCSPIVINLENGSYPLSGPDDPVAFDIDADGSAERLAWTARGSAVAFLALDRNGNGTIDNGSELFGDATRVRSGERAANGFEALKEFDVNGDGFIDRNDESWTKLLLWTDANHDGISQPAEFIAISQSPVLALKTNYRWTGRRDSHGNLYRYQGLAHSSSGVRAIYDVYFRRPAE